MKTALTWTGRSLKAIYAGAGAALTGLGTALVEAHTFSNISDGSWITIASLSLAAAGAVFGVTNSTPAATSSAAAPK